MLLVASRFDYMRCLVAAGMLPDWGGRRCSVSSSRRSSGIDHTGALLADNTADVHRALGHFEVQHVPVQSEFLVCCAPL